MKNHSVAIGLGSNLGNKEQNIHHAVQYLSDFIEAINLSELVVSEALDCAPDAPSFINAALIGQTHLSPQELLNKCMAVEQKMGRPAVRAYHADRIIDIDILLFDSMVIDKQSLSIPHPEMHLRDFVMKPLSMIAPGWSIPGQGTVQECLDRLSVINNEQPA